MEEKETNDVEIVITKEEKEESVPEIERQDVKIDMKNTEVKSEAEESKNKLNCVLLARKLITKVCPKNETTKNLMVAVCIHLAVLSYATAAVLHWNAEGRPPLVLGDGLGLFLCIAFIAYWCLFYYKIIKPVYQTKIFKSRINCNFLPACTHCWCKNAFYIIPPVLFAIFLINDTAGDRKRLTGLLGIATIYFVGFLFSKHPSAIRWDILYRGTLIQVIMAICTVRWDPGRIFFTAVGNKIERFLSYSYVGASFVYSDNLIYNQTVFAFQCLSVIFFINFVVEVLFYYQILQRIFLTLGSFLQKTIGTTPIESINCCVSVFLGMNEAMLVIKLYLKDLTQSELLAVLLGELSTVAGSVFAAYTSFGVKPGYLVSASVMSAPAALSLSKLLYPETEVSKTKAESLKIDTTHREKFDGPLSAGCDGAISAVTIVANIIATLITFISLIAFADGIVSYLAELIGYENVTLVSLLAKCFIPVAFLLGIEAGQCEIVGELIATKAIINEFVAYQKLGNFKKQNMLSKKAEAIATYALCSFSNPAAVASIIAMVSVLCPEQLQNTTKLAFRAYIGGIVTCFLTASTAGLLMPSDNMMNAFPDHVNVTGTDIPLIS